MARTYKDLCIEDLADELARLTERVTSLEADVAAYRALIQAALARLAQATTLIHRQRATIASLLKVEGYEVRQRGPDQPWYPPVGTPEPPASMVRAEEMHWGLA